MEIFTTCAHMICNMEELEKVGNLGLTVRCSIAGSSAPQTHTPGRGDTGHGGGFQAQVAQGPVGASLLPAPHPAAVHTSAQDSLVCHGLVWKLTGNAGPGFRGSLERGSHMVALRRSHAGRSPPGVVALGLPEPEGSWEPRGLVEGAWPRWAASVLT